MREYRCWEKAHAQPERLKIMVIGDAISLKQSIDTAKARGVDVLGTMATWSIPTSAGIPRDEFLLLMGAEGLPNGTVPDSPSHSTALRRAVQRMNGKGKVKLKKLKGNVVDIYAAYSLIEDKSNVAIISQPQGHVELGSGGSLTFSDPTAENSWGATLKSFYTHNLDSSDIRDTIKRAITKESAFPIRPSGGVYFVPESGAKTLDGIQNVCKQIKTGPGSDSINFVLLPILGDDRSKDDLKTAFTDSTVRRIQQTQERLSEFFGDGKRKQVNASISKVREIDEIRGLVQAYEALLDAEMMTVADNLKQLEEFSKDRLDDALSGRKHQISDDDSDFIEGLGTQEESEEKRVTSDDVDAFLDDLENN